MYTLQDCLVHVGLAKIPLTIQVPRALYQPFSNLQSPGPLHVGVDLVGPSLDGGERVVGDGVRVGGQVDRLFHLLADVAETIETPARKMRQNRARENLKFDSSLYPSMEATAVLVSLFFLLAASILRVAVTISGPISLRTSSSAFMDSS